MRAGYTLGLKRHSPGVTDSHGNVTPGWAAPFDWKVYGIAPSTSQEPLVDRLAVTADLTVYAPQSPLPGPHDRVVIDSSVSPAWAGEWEVDGEVGDYTNGPFGFEPGVTVSLKRAVG